MKFSVPSVGSNFCFKLAAALVFVAGTVLSAQSEAVTLNCRPHPTPPADQNFSAQFFHSKIDIGLSTVVDLGVAELDIFSSCGAQNIGRFNSATDTYSKDPKTGIVSFARTFLSPIHEGVVEHETLTLQTISETATEATLKILYRSQCFHYYQDFDYELICQKR